MLRKIIAWLRELFKEPPVSEPEIDFAARDVDIDEEFNKLRNEIECR